MAVKQFESQNRKKRGSGLMDKDLDDSLQEIRKLLFVNAWTTFVLAKENCISGENKNELDDIHKILYTLISNWTFQNEMR